ncbi:glutamate racemase [Veillonella sp.]|uniref:glutamate racemase n=1 Tax=Veillonella sp. TaxID=1926307 RepID=UPI0025F09A7A|nr:glutamate racemase [Veillonella sp.]
MNRLGPAEANTLPIGVFDSGVGGLTVLSVLRTMFPHEDFIYVGDSANNPVGNRPKAEISQIAMNIGHFLATVPVKMAVVACNTFSVVALEELQETFDFPVIGVSKGVRTAIDMSQARSIAIMATKATIESHKHKEEAHELDASVAVWEQACPDLAHLIEQGHLRDEVIHASTNAYLTPIIASGADTVVLGCTHFPFLTELMQGLAGPTMQFIDPSYETAQEVKDVLTAQQLVNPQTQAGTLDICFTKDLPLAKRMISLLIPPEEFTLRHISL